MDIVDALVSRLSAEQIKALSDAFSVATQKRHVEEFVLKGFDEAIAAGLNEPGLDMKEVRDEFAFCLARIGNGESRERLAALGAAEAAFVLGTVLGGTEPGRATLERIKKQFQGGQAKRARDGQQANAIRRRALLLEAVTEEVGRRRIAVSVKQAMVLRPAILKRLGIAEKKEGANWPSARTIQDVLSALMKGKASSLAPVKGKS